MPNLLTAVWSKLTGTWRLIVVAGVALLLLLLVWLYASSVTSHIGNWWHDRQVAAAKKEIDGLRQQAEAAKQVAQQALEQLEAEKKVTEAEKTKREAAEKVLADKTLNANQKLKAYEDIINKAPTVSPATTDVDALCERAKAIGIDCQ